MSLSKLLGEYFCKTCGVAIDDQLRLENMRRAKENGSPVSLFHFMGAYDHFLILANIDRNYFLGKAHLSLETNDL